MNLNENTTTINQATTLVKLNNNNNNKELLYSLSLSSEYKRKYVEPFSFVFIILHWYHLSLWGNKLDISFSAQYIQDAIKAIGSSEVELSFTSEMKPFIIKNKEDNSVVQLVLPVRTYQ